MVNVMIDIKRVLNVSAYGFVVVFLTYVGVFA